MKRLLQSISSLVVIFALITAAMWLIWGISGRQQRPTAQATPASQEPVQWTIVPPEATPVAQATVTSTVKPQYAPESTSISESEIDFDTVRVVNIEEITAPVGLSVDWSSDKLKALIGREVTAHHVLTGRQGGEYWTAVNPVNLWVWQRQTDQEIQVTAQALAWDWSPDKQAIVYVAPVGEAGFEGELRIFDLKTQTSQTLAAIDIVQGYPGPFWLASNEIVYMDEAQLWMMGPDGANRQRLNNLQVYRKEAEEAGKIEYGYAPEKLAGRLYISPDETRLAYEISPDGPERGYQLAVSDLTGNHRMTMGKYTAFHTWSSDGVFFIYQQRINYNDELYFRDLWLANKDGSNPRRLLDAVAWGKTIDDAAAEIKERPGDVGAVALSPNDKFMVFSEISKNGLWLLNLVTGQWRLLSQNNLLTKIYAIHWTGTNELNVSTTYGPHANHLRLILGE